MDFNSILIGSENPDGSSIATFADPDDNYFQVMTPMEAPAPTPS